MDNIKLITSLAVYFHDLAYLGLIELKVSPLELVKKSFGDNFNENFNLTLEELDRSGRAAMVGLDLAYETYKQELPENEPPSMENFKTVWLTSPHGRKIYETALANIMPKLKFPLSPQDLTGTPNATP